MGGEPPPLDVALSRYGVQYLRKRLLRPASAAAPSQRPHFNFLKSFLPTEPAAATSMTFPEFPRQLLVGYHFLDNRLTEARFTEKNF
jgi:hypothetical protein